MFGYQLIPNQLEKPAGLKISGFNVSNYTSLSLEYDIAANVTPANQNIIKVRTDKGNLTIESKEFAANNKYQTVTVSYLMILPILSLFLMQIIQLDLD